MANYWPKSPFWPTVGRKVPLRPTGGRRDDTFDFSPLGCIVSEFAIKIIIVSKKIHIIHLIWEKNSNSAKNQKILKIFLK